MKKITGYFKIFGLAEDEEGNKDYVGMALSMTVTDEYKCKENVSDEFNLNTIAKACKCNVEDIIPITQEEYIRDYEED